jgi:PAS domain S-box-containing protein
MTETTFDKAIETNKATWWIMELPSGNVQFGEAKTKMLGYPKENFKTYHDFTKLLHKDFYDVAMNAMRDHMSGKADVYETLYKIKTKSGKYITFYDYGKITAKKGNNLTVMGFVFKVPESTKSVDEMAVYRDFIKEASIPELIARLK